MHIFRIKIRWKLLSLISVLLVALSVVLTTQHVLAYKTFFQENFNTQTKLLKNNLLLQAINHMESLSFQLEEELAAYNFSKFAEIVRNDVAQNKTVSYIAVIENGGKRIVYAPESALQSEVHSVRKVSHGAIDVSEGIHDGHTVFILKKTIHMGMEPWGTLVLYIPQSELEEKIAGFSARMKEGIHQSLTDSLLSMGAFLLLFLPIAYVMASRISQPIVELTRHAENVARGNFSPRIPTGPKPQDEVGILEETFDTMCENLHQSYSQLAKYNTQLEEMVRVRTAELEEKNAELETLSVTDRLTQLYNRVKLEEIFAQQINLSRRYSTPFSILLCDIDFFKNINDTYGHIMGDTVLCEFSSLLREQIRESDTIGRWGGEEFLIICPETDADNALRFAERIRSAVHKHPFSTQKPQTISIGVSTFCADDTETSMVQRADKALYTAKNEGRNRVRFIASESSRTGETP